VRLLAAALTGRLPSSGAYVERRVPEIRVESGGGRLRLARDGEHFEGNATFGISKRAERLVVYARHEPGALPPRSNRAGV
jgi:hypothetical protein